MKAIIWKGKNCVEYTEVPEPKCRPGWVKIKVMAVGVCATEVAMIRGDLSLAEPPHILGHEICGDVIELGEGCDGELLHKKVVVETYVGCGECEFCRTGRKHLCKAGEIGYPPYNGGNAQYVVVPQGCVRLLPKSISYDEGAIMEAVACPYGALISSKAGENATVLVQGAGIAGLAFLQTALLFGAKTVYCTVRNDIKAALVKKYGGQVIDLREGSVWEQISRHTNGVGVDFSIDAIGSAETVSSAIQCVKNGGKVILYGLQNEQEAVTLPVNECITRQITITGYTGNEKCWDSMIEMVAQGKLQLKEMVSEVFPMENYADALKLLGSGRSDIIKIVIHPWDLVADGDDGDRT